MGVIKELDPELVWKSIEGYEPILEGEARKLDTFYRQYRCPRCKGDLQKEFDGRHAFSDSDSLIARALLRCPTCRYIIDPHTNLVLESGNPAKMPFDSIPLIKTE
jgi:DNA-directed RNA polymerase subunit RPC12/RpoP